MTNERERENITDIQYMEDWAEEVHRTYNIYYHCMIGEDQ